VVQWNHFAADVSFRLIDCMYFAVENSKWAHLEVIEGEQQVPAEGTKQNLE
jgi:hypothetical protein